MDSPDPIVSVIIPTYNWSSALRYAIRSVLWQTLGNFELLVVGDGCTDDSAEVVASFGDPRIRWHNLPENSGNQPAPNNAGIAMARGRYIAYLGHDDLWTPDHLARLVKALEETGADLAYSWAELIGADPVKVRIICGITASGEYETGAALVPSGIMHRRAMVADIGPWKDYRTIIAPPDREFMERAARAGKKFTPVKRLTVFKFNACWRAGAYVEKPVHQQADYVRRIEENPDFATDELQAIVESLFEKHPSEFARWNTLPEKAQAGRFVENSRMIRGLEPRALAPTELPSYFPPLCDRLDLGSADSADYLWDGWSGQEAGFRWTDGPEAQLVFGLAKITGLQMRIRCAPLIVPGKLDLQTVTISCNGQEAGQWALKKPAMETHTVRLDSKSLQAQNVITLKLPHATSPIRLSSNSTDIRLLGLRVECIEFQRV